MTDRSGMSSPIIATSSHATSTLVEDPLDHFELVGVRLLVAPLDAQLRRADRGRLRDPAGHHHHVQPAPPKHLQAHTVLDVEALQFDRLAGLRRTDVHARVREHAVDVEDDEADALCELCERSDQEAESCRIRARDQVADDASAPRIARTS